MKIRNLIIVGVLASIFFVIAFFPASLAWRFAGDALSSTGVNVERVGGTIWDGYAVTKVRTPVVNGPLLVVWDLSGLRLLMGKAAANVRLQGGAFEFEGMVFSGLGGKGVSDLSGSFDASILNPNLRRQGVKVEGRIQAQDVALSLSGKQFSSVAGLISWTGGKVKPRGRDVIQYPGVKGVLSENKGNFKVSVTDSKGNKPLGEFVLMLEKGLFSLKVLRRALMLAGEPGNGDENEALVNMQQPISF